MPGPNQKYSHPEMQLSASAKTPLQGTNAAALQTISMMTSLSQYKNRLVTTETNPPGPP